MSFEGEAIFQSAKPIKYVFKPSKVKCNYLVVVFSGFNPKGSPPTYNYIRTLQGYDINKLFILDDQGERGCYYLGNIRNFDVESSVVSLITKIANENDIPHGNIICCGSSKGGYAALYFGIKYNFGYVIAGAPQTKLGSYLLGVKEYRTMEFIAGDSSEESRKFLDGLLYDLIAHTKKTPRIYIHVGSGDHHYNGHVIPFKEHLMEYEFDFILDVKNYQEHGEIGKYFQEYLTETLAAIIPNIDIIKIKSLELHVEGENVKVSTISNKKAEYAWYVFRNKERIHVEWYKDNPTFEFTAKDRPGTYYIIAFVKDQNGNVISETTKEFLIN